MIYKHKHRIVDEIKKRIDKGHIVHFLTGNVTNDNFFYDIYLGAMSASETLRRYYLSDADEDERVDYFIHVVNAKDNITCYRRSEKNIEIVSFESMFPNPTVKSPLKRKSQTNVSNNANKEAAENAENAGSTTSARIEKLTSLMRNGVKLFIFLENIEWIANLYGDRAETDWIAAISRWEKMRCLKIVVSLKDMSLLSKYGFDQKDVFIGFPSADEIKLTYFRYLLKNTDKDYKFDMQTLDDISNRMSAGKKTLVECARILRAVLKKNDKELSVKDFEKGFDPMISEKVSWENVRLENSIKQAILNATDAFLNSDDKKSPRKGLIFTGPPGTGKTLIAKALANEANCYFMAPTLAELKGEFVGESSGKVRRIFAEARSNSPTILFIDEADTVFPSRTLSSQDRDSYSNDMVNQFLQELDGAHTGDQKIFTIAATNRPEIIDPAIRSRLSNEPILIPLPNKNMRRLIFDDNLSKGAQTFRLTGKIFEDEVLERSENMSGRDIMNFVKTLKEKHSVLKNDEETAKKFREIFSVKEKAFIEEMMSLNIFSRGNIIHPKENKLRFKDIIGYKDLKDKITRQVSYIQADNKEKNRYDSFKIQPQKGILMYGPPGNGKSVLAKAVAGEFQFYFFKVLSRDFESSYPDEQIKKLERIFLEVTRFSKMMTDSKGILLFFDEFDALAGKHILNTVVRGTLLNYVADENGIRAKDSKILFMAATNFEELIDEAIKRQGRIDTHLFMDNPQKDEGISMLRVFLERDMEKIKIQNDALITRAYEHLQREKGENEFRKYIKLHGQEFYALSKDEQKSKKAFILEETRPSSAELETLYKELKEIAFWKTKEESSLLIDEEILKARFLKNGGE